MTIELIKPARFEPFLRGENVGDVFEIDTETGKLMIDAGVAILATKTAEKREKAIKEDLKETR